MMQYCLLTNNCSYLNKCCSSCNKSCDCRCYDCVETCVYACDKPPEVPKYLAQKANAEKQSKNIAKLEKLSDRPQTTKLKLAADMCTNKRKFTKKTNLI